MAKSRRFEMRLPEELDDRVIEAASEREVSKTELIVEAIEFFLANTAPDAGAAGPLPKLVPASELAPAAPGNSKLDPYPNAPTEPEARKAYFKRRSEAMRDMDTGGRQTFGSGKPEKS